MAYTKATLYLVTGYRLYLTLTVITGIYLIYAEPTTGEQTHWGLTHTLLPPLGAGENYLPKKRAEPSTPHLYS